MMKNLLAIFLFLFLFSDHKITAQNDLKIGQWRTHFPYRTGLSVTTSADAVYWATGLSILKMSKADLSIERLDKLNSLNDVEAQLVRYNAASKTLFVGYKNNNIDLVRTDGGATLNISDIKNNVNILGDKTIYNVTFSGDTAFLACGFGISRLNMRRGEFLSTTFTKLKTYGVALFDGKIWAATEGGIYAVANDPKLNFLDFKIWKKMDVADGFPAAYNSKAITVFDGKLYFDINDTVKVLSQNRPLSITSETGFTIKYLTANGRNLLIGWACENCSGKATLMDKNGVLKPLVGGCIARPTDGTEDAEGRVWLGDLFNGYRYLPRAADGQCTVVEFDSPYSRQSSAIAATDTSVWVTFDRLNGLNSVDSREGFASLKASKWLNFNGFNPAYQSARDATCVAIHPKDGRTFVGTYSSGLFEIKDNKIQKLYNASNTDGVLSPGVGDPGRQRIAGLAFDAKGNLWLSNNDAANALIVLKADGKWAKMAPLPSISLYQIVVDGAGFKWIVVKGGGAQSGIIVFDEGKKIDDPTDDRVRVIDNSNFPKELQNAAVTSLVTDLNGAIWVGTTNGVMVFECGGDPFRTACVGRLVVASLSNISEYLLREKIVNTIAIDGANRKWFGTNSGLFVTSADGREEVAKFNVENSPLPSNTITALAVRPNGEVFVGTDRGLMSYRSAATEGGTLNKPEDQIMAFPNPVRPDYQGVIAVKGFARDANIKITDANGSIVFETKALGGQAIWDGKDFSGRRVSTGVYFVLATNTRNLDAPEAVVAKILVMGQ